MISMPGNEHTFAFSYIDGQMMVFDPLGYQMNVILEIHIVSCSRNRSEQEHVISIYM